MDDARPFGEHDELAPDHTEAALGIGEVGKAGLVSHADEIPALDRPDDLVIPVQDGQQVLGEDEHFAAVPDPDIIETRADGDRHVGEEGPGGRRPDEEIGILANDLQFYEDGWIRNILVALRDLVARKGRAASRAVGHDLVALVQHVLVPELLQDPPYRFYVLVMKGDVRIVEVEPETESPRELVPLVQIGEDARLAFLVEGLDPVFLYLILSVEAQLVLHLDLDGQPVRVPARLPHDTVTPHRLVPADEILDRAGHGMVHAGPAVRGRRALVEDEGIVGGTFLDAAGEDAFPLPELEHLGLGFDRLVLRR